MLLSEESASSPRPVDGPVIWEITNTEPGRNTRDFNKEKALLIE